MKVHYINILMFSLPLNILANIQRNHYVTTYTQNNRSLCECELYIPNYDNDPQMKKLMENFNKQTQQRFEEYDERMKTTRQKCKEQCDKEIQKIILKDKLEKELMDKFATLDTDIQSDSIPTCVCEKSLAEKVEKGCLRCAQNLGGIVAPSSGVLAGIAEAALSVLKPEALKAAIAAAEKAGALAGEAAGLKEGMNTVIRALTHYEIHNLFPEIYKTFVTKKPYTDVTKFSSQIVEEYKKICARGENTRAEWIKFEYDVGIHIDGDNGIITERAEEAVPNFMKSVVRDATGPAESKAADVTASQTPAFKETYMGAVDTAYASYQTAIIASIVAIVVIVLIMVIIYKILRYRRKKKMKKKLQYIKLLEE
ncbi:rifin PIR protein, putative [Plasmodium reichenowi]|uniref:Rifin PIR protein, putative n=1 Tax=Plasmodium reichenowi TaxID=5854 RepID=A0A2P9DS76_PLARE|nr:rifin PIR protein, putative [Plasmodium reichenowi]